MTQPKYSVFYGIKELHRLHGTIVVIDCFELTENNWNYLQRFFTNGARFWLAHNAVFDLGWLQEHDIDIRGKVRCSMLASRLLTNGIPKTQHGLAHVAKRYLDIDVSKEQQSSHWGADVLSQAQLEYAAKDIEVLLELDQILDRKLSSDQLMEAYTLECLALPAMAQMWRTGLPWNRSALEQRRIDYEDDLKEMSKEFLRELDNALPETDKLPRERDGSFNLRAKDEGSIRLGTKKYAGFNINSPKQLLEKFTLILGTPPVDATGKPSASRQTLKSFAADSEIIQTYLVWKKTEKRRQMITSILEKLDDKGYVKASYMQLGADTGRMSSIKPNNQQIPRDSEFRQCVEAPEGWKIVDADFSQMELRLAAALANDENMIQAFIRGEDLHDYTAEQMGCDRQIAKSANFGLLYGAGAEGLRNYAGSSGVLMTLEEATKVRDNWLRTYKGVHAWQNKNYQIAKNSNGNEWAETRIPLSNMRRYLKGDLNRVTVRCNTPIQGAGAAILKCALGNLWTEVKACGEDKVRIAAAVHDELILLVKEQFADAWANKLKDIMENAESKWLGRVPAVAEVSVGNTWEETH
jgi:DNA polymerase I-like protein with 3'-5' exonuclease and polymerase domains